MDADPIVHLSRALSTDEENTARIGRIEAFNEFWTPEKMVEMTEEDDELRSIISLLRTNEQQPSRDDILCYIT